MVFRLGGRWVGGRRRGCAGPVARSRGRVGVVADRADARQAGGRADGSDRLSSRLRGNDGLLCLEKSMRWFGRKAARDDARPHLTRTAVAWLGLAASETPRSYEALVREGYERNAFAQRRSEEHTSELQSLMRISYAVFCLTK